MINDTRKKKLEKGKLVPMIFDYVFTSIFNKESNIAIVENFLSCYFDLPLEEVKGNVVILPRELELENKHTANKQVDLVLKLGSKKINIELSTRMSEGIMNRNIVFACNVHSRSYKYGENDYSNIESTIQVNLIYDKRYHGNAKLKETYYLRDEKGNILSENFRIDVLDMEKGTRMCYTDRETKLARWCKAFVSETVEEFEEAIGEIMEENTKEQLKEEVMKYSQDEEVIALYSAYTKEELERNTLINDAKKEGLKEGKIAIVQNMLKKNMDISVISEISGLSEEEIEGLK